MSLGEKKTFNCQNPSCQQTFTVPLKTLNLQANPTEPYFACPYCLTKVQDPKLKIQEGQVKESIPQKKASKYLNEKPTPACQFHLGYLSERTQKEQIPDDCVLCKSIIECMLKKMRDDS